MRNLFLKVVCLGLTFTSLAMADAPSASPSPTPTPSPVASPSPTPAPVVEINPSTLRVLMLKNNTSILDGVTALHQAKDQVNQARVNLLPAANLSFLLNASASPSFILQAVDVMLPFLLPSNWFDLAQSKHLLEVGKASYLALELNQYASAYALYETIEGDIELRAVLEQQYEDLENIVAFLQAKGQVLGTVASEDMSQAQAKAELALGQVSQMDELVTQEKAAFRHAMGLPIDAVLQFDAVHVAASPEENTDPAEIIKETLPKSPEMIQINEMVAAAKDAHWASVFSFLSGASLGNDSGSSLSHLSGGVNVNLGFGYFLGLHISNENLDDMTTHITEITQEETQLVEASFGSVSAALKQYGYAQDAEQSLQSVYQIELQKYNLGLTDLLHVFSAEDDVATASLTRVKAQTDLDNQRIDIDRILISDQFAQIPNCELTDAAKKGADNSWWDWFRGIFGSSDSYLTVDQACQVTQHIN